MHQKCAGSVASQGTYLGFEFDPQIAYGEQLSDVSLSHRCSSLSLPTCTPSSLKSIKIKISSGEDFKKVK